MAFTNSPGIVTNGLVFLHDMNNVKSYAGPPISNSVAYTYPNIAGAGTAAGYSSVGGSEIVNIPSLGPVTTYYNLIQNNYSAVSTNCCPSLFQYGSMAVTGSTLYTYGIVYKCDSGYTGANFMYRYEYNGATYVTEAGVFNSASQVALGDGWYYMLATFTTQPTTTVLNSTGLWYYQYSPYVDKISVAKILITPGNYTGLHPKYWPAMNTTRTTAQAIKDLTGNNTVTANSLTYGTDGTPSFNGSSSYLTVPSSTSLNITSSITLAAWINPTSSAGYPGIIAKGYATTGGYSLQIRTDNSLWFELDSTTTRYTYNPTSTLLTLSAWSYVVATYDGSTMNIYINGQVVGAGTAATVTMGVISTAVSIGQLPGYGTVAGQISQAQIYNRALLVSEIQQNFNALRGRYGL